MFCCNHSTVLCILHVMYRCKLDAVGYYIISLLTFFICLVVTAVCLFFIKVLQYLSMFTCAPLHRGKQVL